jgi:CheY-like chemotaxis protein
MADPNQIELVMLNLAINARDAMPVGGQLLIETSNSAYEDRRRPADLARGEYVCIAVSDTGTGMTEDVLAKALEPFFTTKEPGRGSGLGLSMVHGVAKQSGGGVGLWSRLGQGTTVRVYVPRAEAAAVPRSDDRVVPRVDPEALAGWSVLLIDDDPDVRQVTANLLAELGCRVLAVDSGRAGITALDNGAEIGLAVIDFAMPGMNGIEASEAIRARRPGLPIVIITGFADMDLGGARLDGLPLLKKPFQRAELAAMLVAAAGPGNADRANLVRLRPAAKP